eukprot:TRINITY_DN49316_c0_g2_i1.p1 TRINITY_DN49316_c0_g2~~TRINITY_DN49316_c0_g2_i1.p1  ORF type:complete len:906 (-),score=256.73 TRINITY_DN49316_c0_g2_i1:233-2950(-)
MLALSATPPLKHLESPDNDVATDLFHHGCAGPGSMLSGGLLSIKSKPISRALVTKTAAKDNTAVPLAPFGWPQWDLSYQLQGFQAKLSQVSSGFAGSLTTLLKRYPYCALPGHYLYRSASRCLELLQKGDDAEASKAIKWLDEEVRQEEFTCAALHELFLRSVYETGIVDRRMSLCMPHVMYMLEYLGFPADKPEAQKFVDAVDMDRDSQVSVAEFQAFIGRLGGSLEVFFATRKSAFQRKASGRLGLLAESESGDSLVKLRARVLEAAGIEEELQHVWRLVLPSSELEAATPLKPCQQKALTTIRNLARTRHRQALWKLQSRLKKLGYSGREMELTLAWIREEAPIIIQVDIATIGIHFMNDTHYRNQFETRTSGGLLSEEGRKQWETDLFKGAYDGPDVKAFDRCKYGCLNVMNDYRGVCRTEMYGGSYMYLKDCRLRCTFSPRDSGNLHAESLAVADYFAHQLMEYTDAELLEVVKVATNPAQVVGSSAMVRHLKYKEAQIHGEVDLYKHVDRLVACDSHNTGGHFPGFIKKLCERFGWKFSWVSEEKARLEEEAAREIPSPLMWRERLMVQPDDAALRRHQEALVKKKDDDSRRASKEGAGSPKAPATATTAIPLAQRTSNAGGAPRRPSVSKTQEQAAKTAAENAAAEKAAAEKAERLAKERAEKAAKLKAERAAHAARLKAAIGKAEKTMEEAGGDLEMAWVMLVSMDAHEAAALVEAQQAARESRAGDLRALAMSLSAMASTTEQKIWEKMRDSFQVQVKVWEAQAAFAGRNQNQDRIEREMNGVLDLSTVDPKGAAIMLDDVLRNAWSRHVTLSPDVMDVVSKLQNAGQQAQSRWELAARLEGMALEQSGKFSKAEEKEIMTLIQACDLGNKRLVERAQKLLFNVPSLADHANVLTR